MLHWQMLRPRVATQLAAGVAAHGLLQLFVSVLAHGDVEVSAATCLRVWLERPHSPVRPLTGVKTGPESKMWQPKSAKINFLAGSEGYHRVEQPGSCGCSRPEASVVRTRV